MRRAVRGTTRFAAAPVALALLLGCTETPVASPRPPAAEFLVAAGDSTFWVTATPDGLRVRSAPLLLTRHDGGWQQLVITEDIVDYLDAEFVRERLVAMSLGRPDSVLLFADEGVSTAMRRWREAHPDEEPIDPDEEDAPEPESSASDFLEVINVHGRWVSWAHALDLDVTTEPVHRHTRRRGVSDARTGDAATLEMLLSDGEARRVREAGRAMLDTMLDVVRTAADERAERARATLSSFVFDPSGFSLVDVGRRPAIAFHVGGTGADGEALELLLPPIVLTEPPAWWRDVAPSLPEWAADSLSLSWSGAGYVVRGTVDSTRTRLLLALEGAPAGVTSAGGAAPARWPIADVPIPAYQFLGLDRAGFDDAQRRALLEAFEQASLGDPFATRAHHVPSRASRRRSNPFSRTSVR